MPQLHKTTDLKVLAILGGLFYVALFVGMIWAVIWVIQADKKSNTLPEGASPEYLWDGSVEQPPAKPEPVKKGGLGSEGSVCGGTERLPCMPGLQCAVSKGESMGVCAKLTPVDNQPVLQ